MKFRSVGVVFGACCLLLLVGCQTGPFSRPVAEERLFPAGPETVFEEVRNLLEGRNYRLRRVDAAAGTIDAFSPVLIGGAFGDAIQRRVRVSVVEEARERTRVEITATVLEESGDSRHGRSTFERPLSDPRFVATIFDELGEAIAPEGKAD